MAVKFVCVCGGGGEFHWGFVHSAHWSSQNASSSSSASASAFTSGCSNNWWLVRFGLVIRCQGIIHTIVFQDTEKSVGILGNRIPPPHLLSRRCGGGGGGVDREACWGQSDLLVSTPSKHCFFSDCTFGRNLPISNLFASRDTSVLRAEMTPVEVDVVMVTSPIGLWTAVLKPWVRQFCRRKIVFLQLMNRSSDI